MAEPLAAAAIVLAAGASTRMGANKTLLELRGEPLVHRAARVALEAALDPVVVVLGRDADAAREVLDDLAVRIVVNPDFTGPTGTSLRCGLDQLDAATRAVIVVLADMVRVDAGMLRALRAAATDHPAAPAAASRYGDVVAPPHLFRRGVFDELRRQTGPGAGRSVIERHRDRVTFVEWPRERLTDIDTPADYNAARRAPEPGAGRWGDGVASL